jgi:hypothetical protein
MLGVLDHQQGPLYEAPVEKGNKSRIPGQRHRMTRQSIILYGGVCMEKKESEGMIWSLLLWSVERQGCKN